MKRGRKIALTIALVIWVILLAFTFYYLYDVYTNISSPIPSLEVYEHTRVEANGEAFDMDKGDIVSTQVNGRDYSIKIFEARNRDAEFVINDFLYFTMSVNEDKKLDLNGDSINDLQIHIYSITNGVTTLYFREINERQSISGDVQNAIDRFERNASLQSSFMILLALVVLLILIFFVIKGIIIPKIEDNKKLSRKSEIEVFNELFKKFKEHESKGNKDKAKRVYEKLYHLYRYMSSKDKALSKSKIDEMAKYLK